MRHRVKSRRLNRPPAHLKAMLNNLAVSVILYERVKTTQAKAKAVKPLVEKIITVAKKKTPMAALRELNRFLPDQNASQKAVKELSKRYHDRSSGFTRLTLIGFRAGDAAPMAQIELI